jgi:ribulose-5-phosphate 4-epimerase/fuculose-1-phosphate aldolase
MLANHGPVVAGKSVEAACNAIEELEATAKLALLLRGCNSTVLSETQIRQVVDKFDVEWD